jgi:GGDEF domain-containing protein
VNALAKAAFVTVTTGDEAAKAAEIAGSIRSKVEGMELDERFRVTMHFGITQASCHWTSATAFSDMVKEALEAIRIGQKELQVNRCYLGKRPPKSGE